MVVGRSEFKLRGFGRHSHARRVRRIVFRLGGFIARPHGNHWCTRLGGVDAGDHLAGQTALVLVLVLAFGYPLQTSLAVAVALAQVGEFSFILATVGREMNLLDTTATGALIAASIVSISL